MRKINSFEDMKSVVLSRWSELSEIRPEYLSEAGNAAKEAYCAVYWYCSFHETFQSLSEDEDFMNLVNTPNKHPEFYRILRLVNNKIKQLIK